MAEMLSVLLVITHVRLKVVLTEIGSWKCQHYYRKKNVLSLHVLGLAYENCLSLLNWLFHL